MSNPYFHAKSSARKFGGKTEDYQELHDFMDSTKSSFCNIRHRAVLHSSFGIYLAERVFGVTIKRKSDGAVVPTRPIFEQHVLEDCGRIPTMKEWLHDLPVKDFMILGTRDLESEFRLTEGTQRASGRKKQVSRRRPVVAPSGPSRLR